MGAIEIWLIDLETVAYLASKANLQCDPLKLLKIQSIYIERSLEIQNQCTHYHGTIIISSTLYGLLQLYNAAKPSNASRPEIESGDCGWFLEMPCAWYMGGDGMRRREWQSDGQWYSEVLHQYSVFLIRITAKNRFNKNVNLFCNLEVTYKTELEVLHCILQLPVRRCIPINKHKKAV